MTFESTSPLGNRKGCFTLGFSQLPVHVSNQWRRKINRYSIRKPTKYFTKPKFSIMRLCGVFFLERNGMRELGICHRKISYVCTSWRFIWGDFILIKWKLKAFGTTAFLKCTLFLVPLLIHLQVALSNLIFPLLQKWWIHFVLNYDEVFLEQKRSVFLLLYININNND